MSTESLSYQEHTIYYQNYLVQPIVVITNMQADFGLITFAIKDIASVFIDEIPPSMVKKLIGFELILVGLLFGAIIAFAFPNAINFSIAGMVVLLFVSVGIWLMSTQKAKYVVKISTTSSEFNAFTTTNRKYIDDIVWAINKAINERG